MSVSAIINATATSFEQDVLETSKQTLVLVDFWAEWCGPCKAVAPILADLATRYADQLQVVKVDVDAHSTVASNYDVSGIPTVILVKDGAEVARSVGAVQLGVYEKLIAPHLA